MDIIRAQSAVVARLVPWLLLVVAGCGGSTTASRASSKSSRVQDMQSTRKPAEELRVLTFNFRHDRDQWRARFDLIAEQLARLRPQLIGAQEVEIGVDQTRALADRLASIEGAPHYYVFERLKHGPDAKRGEGLAIYSLYPIVKTDWRKLSHGRIALFARVELPDKSSLDIYNTHLHDKGGDAVRLAQAQFLLRWIRENSAGRDTLLLGDFNADPNSATVHHLCAYLQDAHAVVAPDGSGLTVPVVLSHDKPAQTLRRRIDYIFFRFTSRRWSMTNVRTAMNVPDETGLMPSDHLAVLATLRQREQ